MAEDAPFLPGLSPVAGKPVLAHRERRLIRELEALKVKALAADAND